MLSLSTRFAQGTVVQDRPASLNKFTDVQFVSGEGLAPIVSAYSRLILVDGTVL